MTGVLLSGGLVPVQPAGLRRGLLSLLHVQVLLRLPLLPSVSQIPRVKVEVKETLRLSLHHQEDVTGQISKTIQFKMIYKTAA